jgi:calcyclin binding protein
MSLFSNFFDQLRVYIFQLLRRSKQKKKKDDPSASLMDMMKDLYDEGDENMKKIIGEAMMKSRSGEKPAPPSTDDL